MSNLRAFKADDGDLIEIDDFIARCKNQSFIDYDGMGNWATETMCERGDSGGPRWIYPSQIREGLQPPSWATHVLWYNR